MDAPRDPYAELGVPHTAPAAEITNAYQRLVRRLHPDTRSPAASAAAADIALTRIMAAYAILNDPLGDLPGRTATAALGGRDIEPFNTRRKPSGQAQARLGACQYT